MDTTELGRLPRSYEVTPAGLFHARRAAIQMEATAASPLGSQPARHPEHDTHIHWIDGGETSIANGCLLCRRHHRFVHELGWQLRWGASGEIIAIKPWWLGNDSGCTVGVAPPLAS